MAGSYLIYDGECPFCSRYVQMTRLTKSAGPVRLINARDGGPEVQAATQQGYDLDDGMLLNLDGQVYHGANCLNRLALLTTRSDVFNRFCGLAFQSPTVSRLAYPALRFGRNLTLRTLGRRPPGKSQ